MELPAAMTIFRWVAFWVSTKVVCFLGELKSKNIDTIKHALAINIGEHQLFSMTRAFVVDRFSGSAWSPGVQSGTSLQAPPVPKVWQVAS